MDDLKHSFSVDVTIVISKKHPKSEHIVIIFMTLDVTIATICLAEDTLLL